MKDRSRKRQRSGRSGRGWSSRRQTSASGTLSGRNGGNRNNTNRHWQETGGTRRTHEQAKTKTTLEE